MRVLHIANGDDKMGSGKCLYELLAYELRSENMIPIVINPFHNKMNDWCDINGIENYSICFPVFMYPYHDKQAKLKYLIRKLQYLLLKGPALKELEKKVDLKSMDVVHTNNCLNDLGRMVAKKYHKPLIWHLREGGLTQHNLHPFIKKFADYMNEYTSAFIAVSKAVANEWIKYGIMPEKIKVIHDGVKLPEKQIKINKNKKIRFVIAGSISEVKGQIQIINAFDNLPEIIKAQVELDIWGGGEKSYIDFISKVIEERNLGEIIHLKGFVNDIWSVLSDYDVGFNCTRLEAFGRTTVEYLISGLPVIASDLGANLEIINENNGMLYQYDNTDDLAHKIVEMVVSLERFDRDWISADSKEKYNCDMCNERIVEAFREFVK